MARGEHKGNPNANRSAHPSGKERAGSGATAEREHGRGSGDNEYPGRTIGGNATSYQSVGGGEQNVADDNLANSSGPVHDVSFRPAPGGAIEERGRQGRDVPYTGEVASTRGATFEEDPATGKTADEQEGDFITRSLEERTRGYESG